MNTMERQAALGREWFELNTGTLRRLAELQTEGVQKVFETNRTFAEKLPEVKDITSFMELQREYGEAMWNGFTEGMKANGEVLKEAVESAGELLRGAFATEEPKAPETTKKSAKPAAAKAAA
ncbi:MAG: phasin family protein [Gammaproteobacteria bacterium]|nr:phasin family protein [Gammaproteobacteria bacterium]MYF50135.1 phasin family protein [Gammaproteobacteria bacterium]MYG13372.1 phasin family protein [Gammaproteobacteria bacterium]MYH15942.1 phasin family protein [Gammaproteobacteria bacterium]MYK29594.1 phasin family protein [Gammaproteobacteria bacterium]